MAQLRQFVEGCEINNSLPEMFLHLFVCVCKVRGDM